MMIDDPDCEGSILCTCCAKWIRKGERYMRFLRSGMTRTPPWTGHKIQWIANATQRLYLPLNMIGVV